MPTDNDMNPLDTKFKYADFNHGMYYSDPYKTKINNITSNFAMMTNLEDDNSRDVIKHDWAANDKLNMNSDGYPVNVSHHDNMMKQNGAIHSDYYKDLYGMQTHSQYGDGDYAGYPIGQEQNVDTGEIWDKRKETTSFEHEQPHSSSVPR